MRDFRSLEVWRLAHALTLNVYRASASFPAEERFGLTSQLRRAAASVPTNLAEGCGRHGERELGRFLAIAGGSCSETEYLLQLAADLGFIERTAYDDLHRQTTAVKKMLGALHRRVTAPSAPAP